jgi:hypothetical protein
VNDRSAGEVNGVDFGVAVGDAVHHSVDAPDHVGLGEVNDEHPQRHEKEDGGEFHAFGDGANDQSGCDDGEHQLVHGENVLRDPAGIIAVRAGIDVVEKCEVKIAQEGVASVENQTVTANVPQDGDQTGDQHALCHDG